MHAQLMYVSRGAEGYPHWAMKDIDCTARSPIAQCLKRALKHHSHADKVYGDLLDYDKMKFRQSWALKKDWEFLSERREKTSAETHSTAETGEFLPQITIASRIGNCLDPTCLKMAEAYCKNCTTFGKGQMVSYNQFLECETFYYVQKMMTITNMSQWKEMSESMNSVNNWETSAAQGRAIRNYSAAMGLAIDKVNLADVTAHELGFEGWSNLTLNLNVGSGSGKNADAVGGTPRAKGRANPKLADAASGSGGNCPPSPSGKTKGGKQQSPHVKIERDAKECLASMSKVKMDYDTLVALISGRKQRSPGEWDWADSLQTKIDSTMNELKVVEETMGHFPNQYRAAVLSPSAMKGLKKEVGEEFFGKLLSFQEKAMPVVKSLAAQLDNLKRMVEQNDMSHGSVAPKSKAKRAKKN
jgi:hypothetical protein